MGNTSDWPAWVQAVGSIAAIWAAGRFVVLQQREAETAAVEGVAALFDVASTLLQEAAGVLRDHAPEPIRNFDVYRFDDVTRPLAALTPADTRDWRLTELVPQMLAKLRAGRELMDASVTEQRNISTAEKMPVERWEKLHDLEQSATSVYVEATRVLKLVKARRARWWLW